MFLTSYCVSSRLPFHRSLLVTRDSIFLPLVLGPALYLTWELLETYHFGSMISQCRGLHSEHESRDGSIFNIERICIIPDTQFLL